SSPSEAAPACWGLSIMMTVRSARDGVVLTTPSACVVRLSGSTPEPACARVRYPDRWGRRIPPSGLDMRPASLRFLNRVQGVNVNNLTELVVASTVGIGVGLAAGMAGMAMLRRARLRREVRELDPWWQWQKQWQRVEIGLRRVDAIYEGRQVDSADD